MSTLLISGFFRTFFFSAIFPDPYGRFFFFSFDVFYPPLTVSLVEFLLRAVARSFPFLYLLIGCFLLGESDSFFD